MIKLILVSVVLIGLVLSRLFLDIISALATVDQALVAIIGERGVR